MLYLGTRESATDLQTDERENSGNSGPQRQNKTLMTVF